MEDLSLDEIIENEIVCDAYGDEEISSGWYSYMEDCMTFPFEAECLYEINTSPLKVGECVEVIDIGEIESCNHEIHVKLNFCNRVFDVPLAHLKPLNVDNQTILAVRCWYHWLEKGYEY